MLIAPSFPEKSPPAKIVLAVAYPLEREGLKLLLTTALDAEVVGETGDGARVEALVGAVKPDVLLLDLELPNYQIGEVIARLKVHADAGKIVALADKFDTGRAGCALAAGADHCIVKYDLRKIMAAIRGTPDS